MTISGRVTDASIRTRVMANLQRTIARGQQIQDQVSSGKQLTRPSDSPAGAVSALQLRGEVRANQQYSRNADDALGWLGNVDNALSNSVTLVNKVRDLAVRGLSGGSNNAQSNEAMAVEVENIRASIIGYANTKFLDRPVFGGTTTGGVAYDPGGGYVADAGSTSRTVGPNTKVRVDVTGPEAFGSGPDQLFTVLTDIANGLRSGTGAGLSDGLKGLDRASDLLKSTLSDVGARYNRIAQMKQSAQDRLLSVTSQLSDIEDVDLPKAIMELQLQQTSYQAALAASAKVIQPSLIDFLR